MGGFGSYFNNQAQQAQQGLPSNMQMDPNAGPTGGAVGGGVVPPGTGGIKPAPQQDGGMMYAGGTPGFYQPGGMGRGGYGGYGRGGGGGFQSYGRGAWPGQGYGGLPGRYGGGMQGGYQGGGYGGMYGGGGYGGYGFPRGNMYGPGSYGGYGGSMPYGGGSGMYGGPMGPFNFNQMAGGLMGGQPQTNYSPYQPLPSWQPPPPPPTPPWQPPRNLGGGGSCFVAGTTVRMADGTNRAIEDVVIGDKLLGQDDTENVVLEYDHPELGSRALFSLNGGKPFVTAEHPFMSSTGWKSIDPSDTAKENPDLEVETLCTGDFLVRLGTKVMCGVTEIEAHHADPETQLYNFKLSGNNTYYADGFLVHNKQGDGPGGGGGGGGSSGGGKIICTQMNNMYGYGSFRNALWMKYQELFMPQPEWELGYHKLFKKLVDKMPTNRLIRTVLERTARVRTVAIRAEMRGKPIPFEAKIYRLIRPLVFATGWLVKKGVLKRAKV